MWCGQSFKSLADMTQHMKVTQHYTNIISQEQIISWRNPEESSSKSQLPISNGFLEKLTTNSNDNHINHNWRTKERVCFLFDSNNVYDLNFI